MSIDTSQLPRFSPVVYEQADERTRQIIDQLEHPQKDHPVFMTLMHDPELERLLSPLVQYLKKCPNLPARHREIAILRIAWLCGVDDQWVNHSFVALASGVTQEEIDRVREGAHAAGWSEAEAAILRCVDELNRAVGSATTPGQPSPRITISGKSSSSSFWQATTVWCHTSRTA